MSTRTRPRLVSRTNLVLHVHCHGWLFALDADHVEHVALADETRLEEGDELAPEERAAGLLGVVPFGSRSYAAWDLATLLGNPPEATAWIFLNIPRAGGRSLPVSLRTGSCRTVGPLPSSALSPLPARLCPSRPGAIRGAYLTDGAQAGRPGGLAAGLFLDLAHLLSRDELRWSKQVIEAARRSTA